MLFVFGICQVQYSPLAPANGSLCIARYNTAEISMLPKIYALDGCRERSVQYHKQTTCFGHIRRGGRIHIVELTIKFEFERCRGYPSARRDLTLVNVSWWSNEAYLQQCFQLHYYCLNYRVRAPDAQSQRAPAPSPYKNHRNKAAELPIVDNIIRF